LEVLSTQPGGDTGERVEVGHDLQTGNDCPDNGKAQPSAGQIRIVCLQFIAFQQGFQKNPVARGGACGEGGKVFDFFERQISGIALILAWSMTVPEASPVELRPLNRSGSSRLEKRKAVCSDTLLL